MYLNKGTYGHDGGLLHSGIHAISTWGILVFVNPSLAIAASCIDFIIHYHTDWAKVNICKYYNLKPDNSEWYWHLLGLDQLIHCLTYIGIIWLIK